MAGRSHQFDQHKKKNFRIFKFMWRIFDHAFIDGIKVQGLICVRVNQSGFKNAPAKILGNKSSHLRILAQRFQYMINDEDDFIFKYSNLGPFKSIIGLLKQIARLNSNQLIAKIVFIFKI